MLNYEHIDTVGPKVAGSKRLLARTVRPLRASAAPSDPMCVSALAKAGTLSLRASAVRLSYAKTSSGAIVFMMLFSCLVVCYLVFFRKLDDLGVDRQKPTNPR